MRLKAHHIFIVVILAPSILGVVFSELQPTSLYKPDTWAGISIALGASILTLVGIITSILTSKENDRRAEFNDNLGEMTRKLEEKMKTNPDKSLIGVYEKSQQKIKSLLEKMEPLKYADGLFGIISFTFFVSSALFAISGYPFKWIVFAFFAGIAFLGGYVIYYMEECLKMDNLSTIPKKKGKLTLLSIKVDDEKCHFEEKGNEVFFTCTEKPNRLELKVRFEGEVRNGFLDAFVKYTNDLFTYIPDSNTYLSDFGFTNCYRLTILEGKKFDTGILQTIDKPLELSFDIVLLTESNTLIAAGIVDGQMKQIYKNCSVPKDFVVDFIDVRLYEDPSFKPSFKRRIVDQITLTPRRDSKKDRQS